MEPEYKDSGIDYTETLETYPHNPGRGHSPAPWFILKADGSLIRVHGHTPVHISPRLFAASGTATPMFSLSDFSSGNSYDNGQPHNYIFLHSRPRLVGGANAPVSEEALATLRRFFGAAREAGVQLVPRFGYAPSHSEGGRGWGIVGAEPDELSVIAEHIKAVCSVINEYADTVLAVEAGTLGPWGEMHSTPYDSPAQVRAFMDAWLDALHPDIPLTVRQMRYFTKYLGVSGDELMTMLPLPEEHPLHRVGLYNDGYLGSWEDCYTWARESEDAGHILHRSQGVEFMRDAHRRAPYGGELAYVSLPALREGTAYSSPSPIYRDDFVKELYHTHLTYLHNITENTNVIKELKAIPLEARHGFDGMPDLTAYYGQSLYKLMLDHMGYRFVLRRSETAVDGGGVHLRFAVENTGFADMLFRGKCELIIFDDGDTASFHPIATDPRRWRSGSVCEQHICLSTPEKAGNYRVYLRVGARVWGADYSGENTVRFANTGCFDPAHGANRLGTFTVE